MFLVKQEVRHLESMCDFDRISVIFRHINKLLRFHQNIVIFEFYNPRGKVIFNCE